MLILYNILYSTLQYTLLYVFMGGGGGEGDRNVCSLLVYLTSDFFFLFFLA